MARRWCPVGPVTEAILALLCALGAAVLLWLLLGWLVRPASVHNLWTVIPARGDGETLDEALRKSYAAVGTITFKDAHYRHDIEKIPAGNR